jgi:hypothetical protein
MFKITEIKKWAKEKGYNITKKVIAKASENPEEEDENVAEYHWFKIDDPSVCGISPSVSKVTKAVYNNMTNNIHLEYQQNYKKVEEV